MSKGQTGMTRASAIQFLELPIDQRNFEKKELDKAFRQKARILHPDSPTGIEFKKKEKRKLSSGGRIVFQKIIFSKRNWVLRGF